MTVSNFTNNLILKSEVKPVFLGLTEYKESLRVQNNYCEVVKLQNQKIILGFEYEAVITLGRRAELINEINENTTTEVIRTSRGGLATLHSSGQLIIYPIINLRSLNMGVKNYIHLLLKTTEVMLKNNNIDCVIDEKNIGLYTKNGKIAFCGVQIINGISSHGLSINVSNDLNLFNQIKSCGVAQPQIDKMGNYGNFELEVLFDEWVHVFTDLSLA